MASSCDSSCLSSQERTNFAVICRIVVDVLRVILWQVLIHEIPAADLPNRVQTNQKKLGKLDVKIKTWLCGISPSSQEIPTVEKFDVSSLYLLIRNLCSQVPTPSAQWGKPPQPGGTNLGDDIERVRELRNTYGHATQAKIDTANFSNLCIDIKNVASRFDAYFSASGKTMKCDFRSDIDAILTCSMDKTCQDFYIGKIKEIAVLLDDLVGDVKQEVGSVNKNVDILQNTVEKVNGSITQVRLAAGIGEGEGILEILHKGVWGTVCTNIFDSMVAKVICRMLQLPTINECNPTIYASNTCGHTDDIAIGCEDDTITKVRLAGGRGEREGILEIMHIGVWGTVCDDNFDNMAAKVVCRMLHLPTDGAQVIPRSQVGANDISSLRIWLNDVICIGTETSIGDCSHRNWGESGCGHNEDVAIKCGDDPITKIRLVGGRGDWEGIVEIIHNGVWGTVCDDFFDNMTAKVVCGMLHLPTDGSEVVNSKQFNTGNRSSLGIWLDEVICVGTESSIGDCSHRTWSENNCDHDEDVAIRCGDERLECYHCDSIGDPTNCRDTIFCSSFESCQTSMYDNNDLILYSQSCQSKFVCDALNSVPSIIGRKRVTGLKTTCCDTALCNNVTIDGHGSQGLDGTPGGR